MRELDHNAHSVFLMYYHLILVVKYRRQVIDDDISERAKDIFVRISSNYGIEPEFLPFDCRWSTHRSDPPVH